MSVVFSLHFEHRRLILMIMMNFISFEGGIEFVEMLSLLCCALMYCTSSQLMILRAMTLLGHWVVR
jgi:hypothetical protein